MIDKETRKKWARLSLERAAEEGRLCRIVRMKSEDGESGEKVFLKPMSEEESETALQDIRQPPAADTSSIQYRASSIGKDSGHA